jgi:hypothetical protein
VLDPYYRSATLPWPSILANLRDRCGMEARVSWKSGQPCYSRAWSMLEDLVGIVSLRRLTLYVQLAPREITTVSAVLFLCMRFAQT